MRRVLLLGIVVGGILWPGVAAAAPIISIESSGLNGAGQFFAEFSVQAPGGIDTINLFDVNNLTTAPLVAGDNFFFGSIEHTVFTATVINQLVLARLGLTVFDSAGASTRVEYLFDPIGQTVEEVSTVPEPASLLLLGSGLAAAALEGRRRKPHALTFAAHS